MRDGGAEGGEAEVDSRIQVVDRPGGEAGALLEVQGLTVKTPRGDRSLVKGLDLQVPSSVPFSTPPCATSPRPRAGRPPPWGGVMWASGRPRPITHGQRVELGDLVLHVVLVIVAQYVSTAPCPLMDMARCHHTDLVYLACSTTSGWLLFRKGE